MAKLTMLSNLTKEDASGKIISFDCGCETYRCFKKHDCSAKHSCEDCTDKIVSTRCSQHQHTSPDVTKVRVMFI